MRLELNYNESNSNKTKLYLNIKTMLPRLNASTERINKLLTLCRDNLRMKFTHELYLINS